MKSITTVYLDPELHQKAKDANLNISQLTTDAIEEKLGPQKIDEETEEKAYKYIKVAKDNDLEVEEIQFIVDNDDNDVLGSHRLYKARFKRDLKSWEFVLLKRKVLRTLGFEEKEMSQAEKEIQEGTWKD